MSINTVTLSGNLTRDIEIRRTQAGKVIASFGIAVNDRKKNGQTGEWEDVPNFFDITGFGERWLKVREYVSKGSRVTIQGRLRWSQWEKDGQKRSKVEVVADEIDFTTGGQKNRPAKQDDGYDDGHDDGGYAIDASTSVYDSDIPF